MNLRVDMIRVIDGDSFEARILSPAQLGNDGMIAFNLEGFDSPEIVGKDRSKGILAKRLLANAIENEELELTLTSIRSHKRPRVIAYRGPVCINVLMNKMFKV